MTIHNCELCGQSVRVVGDTTLHYEPAPEELHRPGEQERGSEQSYRARYEASQAALRDEMAELRQIGEILGGEGSIIAVVDLAQAAMAKIRSLETTVLEQSDQIESLSAECERYRRVICDIETCKLVGELSDEIAGYLKLSDNLLVFVEWQAAKIERLTWIDYGDGPASVFCRHCSRKKPKHTPGCPAGEE